MADTPIQLFWQPEAMTEPMVLPARVADEFLSADVDSLRVLLWASRHHLVFDPAACGAALGLPPAVCTACIQTWVDRGVLRPPMKAQQPTAPAAAHARPAGRPMPVKPLVGEVLAYQQAHPDFSSFVGEVSVRLGKPVGHADTATLLYLLDTVGLPPEVILTEVMYAVSLGRGNMRYIEKIALDWADKELTTLTAVDEHIRYLERCRKAAVRVQTVLALDHPLTAAQAQQAELWLDGWQVREDMLRRAAQMTVDKKGQLNLSYLGGILARWHDEGIDTPEKIPEKPVKKRGAAATDPEQSSLDLGALDEQMQRYTPVIRK